jgi:hypothetical protein
MWDQDGNLGPVLSLPKLSRTLFRSGAYDGLTLNFLQQESTFWARELWNRSGARLDTSLTLAADYELWCRLADHAEPFGVSAVLAGSRRHPAQRTAHSMLAYLAEMEACRAARPWGSTERSWLARGLKRRLARLLYRVSPERNVVLYDPSAFRWRIR